MKYARDRSGRLVETGGYTLVELIVVILIIGILSSAAATLILWPVRQYVDSGRREVLVTEAESALRRMARDIRAALPNSVRVTDPATGASFALEFLPVLDGGKVNIQVHAACNKLAVTGTRYEFDLQGVFRDPATRTGPGIRLVYDNLGTTGNDVYADAGAAIGTRTVITPAAMTITFNDYTCSGCSPPDQPCGGSCDLFPGNDHICMLQGHQFTSEPPNQRMYVVKTPVSYLCDTAAGTITRYYNYAIQSSQPTTAAAFAAINASSALLVKDVSSCRVVSTASDVRDRGLVTLYLGLTQGDYTVKLVHQAMLDNSR